MLGDMFQDHKSYWKKYFVVRDEQNRRIGLDPIPPVLIMMVATSVEFTFKMGTNATFSDALASQFFHSISKTMSKWTLEHWTDKVINQVTEVAKQGSKYADNGIEQEEVPSSEPDVFA